MRAFSKDLHLYIYLDKEETLKLAKNSLEGRIEFSEKNILNGEEKEKQIPFRLELKNIYKEKMDFKFEPEDAYFGNLDNLLITIYQFHYKSLIANWYCEDKFCKDKTVRIYSKFK
jgi:hypothetical protein